HQFPRRKWPSYRRGYRHLTALGARRLPRRPTNVRGSAGGGSYHCAPFHFTRWGMKRGGATPCKTAPCASGTGSFYPFPPPPDELELGPAARVLPPTRAHPTPSAVSVRICKEIGVG